MSEDASGGDQATPTVSPEVVSVRDNLANYERSIGNNEWADKFAAMTFESASEVYTAYGERAQGGDPTPQTPDETPEPEGEPELLAGKFKTPEDLAKAYKELESKLGQAKPDTPKEPEGDLEITPQPEGGLLEKLSEHYAEHQSLTDEHYAQLAKGGLSKADVDQYIQYAVAGAQAQQGAAAAQEAALKESAGGQEAYSQMTAWASQNLPESEIQSFNKAVSSDPGVAQFAIEALKAKWTKAVGEGNTSGMVSGAAQASQGVRGFESQAEMVAAFNDPRFHTHPSYRREVEQRMQKTKI
jgi:hypothetical protein